MTDKTPLEKFDEMLDEIIADPSRKPKKKPKKAREETHYELPKTTRVTGDVVIVPGTQPGTEWVVKPANWTCTCPAFVRWPPCKHVKAVRKLVSV